MYNELREFACARMRHERRDHTLQPTALVHEAFLRLRQRDGSGTSWDSREHYLKAASVVMRRILVDSARARQTQKRGGGWVQDQEAVEKIEMAVVSQDVLILDEALRAFEQDFPEKALLVSLRYFGGMSLDESALALGVSRSTAANYWKFSRCWLKRWISTTD